MCAICAFAVCNILILKVTCLTQEVKQLIGTILRTGTSYFVHTRFIIAHCCFIMLMKSSTLCTHNFVAFSDSNEKIGS